MQSLGRFRGIVLLGMGLVACAAAPWPAQAQDAARLEAIEQRIQAVRQEIKALKRALAARDGQLRAARDAAAAARSQAATAQAGAAAPGIVPMGAVPMGAVPVGAVPVGAVPMGAAAAPTDSRQVAEGPPPAASGPQLLTATGKLGQFRLGGITVTLGGYAESAGIFRSRNQVADLGSGWNTGMPLANNPLYYQHELRGSARGSRMLMLLESQPDRVSKVSAYGEVDFLGAAPTANSGEANGYTPRLRQAYATYERSDWGLHVLAGQTWSLLTPNRLGIDPRQQELLLRIDAAYVPGYTWTRAPQLRIVKDFEDRKFWLGLSFESPQATYYVGPNGTGSQGGSVNYANPGGEGFYSGTPHSSDLFPDLVLKAAADTGFGHYEVYGLSRVLNASVSTLGNARHKDVLAGGIGASAYLHLVPERVELQASVLAGQGIGRYGSGQLPDATIGISGAPVALPEIAALVGLIGHPTPTVDVYAYLGTEQAGARAFEVNGKGYGYGSPAYSNAGCDVLLSPVACVGNTAGITQATGGFWWRFLQGDAGTMQAGAQYSYTRRQIFAGIGGAPHTDNNIVIVSFRYFPFQPYRQPR